MQRKAVFFFSFFFFFFLSGPEKGFYVMMNWALLHEAMKAVTDTKQLD